ncbi:hypothetical protein [Halosegnis marinus]|uniref:hypothetical protein n=1 Tax=Halosegnis marinus TaxID=3034023 RepID=UPI00361C7042
MLPATTNIHDRGVSWRVGVVHGGKTSFDGTEPVRTGIDGRPAALALAEELMESYEREVRGGGRELTDVIADRLVPAVRRVD